MSSAKTSYWTFSQPSATAVFCPRCQGMLNMPDEREQLTCPDCPFKCLMAEFMGEGQAAATQQQSVTTLRDEEEAAEEAKAAEYKRATVKEPCPKCNYKKLTFYTLQLRSVDEGQTVFYECQKCGHTFSTNT